MKSTAALRTPPPRRRPLAGNTLTLLALLTAHTATAQLLTNWLHADATAAYGYDLDDVAYGEGRFVAVGAGATLLTSNDGTRWTRAASPVPTTEFTGVLRAAGLWLAVANGGYVVTSTNALDWRLATQLTAPLRAVAWGAGRFVAVGDAGAWFSSTNGQDWSAKHTLSGVGRLVDIVFANGRFLIAEQFGKGYTSSDGSAFTANTFPAPHSSFRAMSVAAGPSVFVAVDNFGRSLVSSNGLTAREITQAAYPLRGVAHGDGYFVAAGGSSSHEGYLYLSSNLTGWSYRFGPDSIGLFSGVAYGQGLFVVVGEGGNIVVSRLRPLLSPPIVTAGQCILRFTGDAHVPYTLETTEDFQAWTAIATNQSTTGLIEVTDPQPVTAGKRFYRAFRQP